MIKSFFKEFREFAMRGNMVDMAIGIIIGAAFGKVVSSLVSDIIMPPLGYLLGKIDFSDLVITLQEKTGDATSVSIKYGLFINNIIDFIIVALAIFIVIKQMNRFTPKKVEEVTTKECPYCYSKIPLKASRCPECTSNL